MRICNSTKRRPLHFSPHLNGSDGRLNQPATAKHLEKTYCQPEISCGGSISELLTNRPNLKPHRVFYWDGCKKMNMAATNMVADDYLGSLGGLFGNGYPQRLPCRINAALDCFDRATESRRHFGVAHGAAAAPSRPHAPCPGEGKERLPENVIMPPSPGRFVRRRNTLWRNPPFLLWTRSSLGSGGIPERRHRMSDDAFPNR